MAEILLDQDAAAVRGDREILLKAGAARIDKLQSGVFVEGIVDVRYGVVGGEVRCLRFG